MKKLLTTTCVILVCAFSASAQIQTNAGVQYLQCMQKDMSADFNDLSNTYFLADSLVSFDHMKGEGMLNWKRYRLSPRQAFNLNGYWPVRMQMLDFPDAAYDNDPNLKIKVYLHSQLDAEHIGQDPVWYFSQPSVQRGLEVNILQEAARGLGIEGDAYADVRDAVAAARSNAADNDLVLVTGSIFLIADLLRGV